MAKVWKLNGIEINVRKSPPLEWCQLSKFRIYVYTRNVKNWKKLEQQRARVAWENMSM